RSASTLPRIALPRLDAAFPFAGDGVEAPRARAGLRVVRIDEAADAVLAAGHADDDLVLHDERRAGEAVALVGLCGRGVPSYPPGLRVERDDVGVERSHEEPIAQSREAAVLRTAAERHFLRQGSLVMPQGPPRAYIDRICVVLRRRQIHDAVDHDGRGLVAAPHARLKDPLKREALH